MIKTIGFRCSPSEINYCILSKEREEVTVIDVNKIVVPLSMLESHKLKYVRNTIKDIINEYEIDIAGIRITEPNSQRMSIERIHIEGVILELFASSVLKKHFFGQIASISKYLEIPREKFKKIINGEEKFDLIAHFSDFGNKEKEAILTALGAFQC